MTGMTKKITKIYIPAIENWKLVFYKRIKFTNGFLKYLFLIWFSTLKIIQKAEEMLNITSILWK